MALFERLLGGDDPEPEPPADAKERRRLEHEERKLKREVKRLEKRLDRTYCATCHKAPINQERLAISKALKDREDRLDQVKARLEAA